MLKSTDLNINSVDQPLLISLPGSDKSKEIHIVLARQILYIQSKGDHICCISAEDAMNSGAIIKSVMNKDIGYYCKLLPSYLFILIHRSCLVNINFIKAYNKTDHIITMADKMTFNIAHRRRKDFKGIINL